MEGWPRAGETAPLGQRQPVHTLQYQCQAEAQLQLDDHQRFVAAPSDEITTPDLALDLVAAPFEEFLDRHVERGLAEPRVRSAGGTQTFLLDHLRTRK